MSRKTERLKNTQATSLPFRYQTPKQVINLLRKGYGLPISLSKDRKSMICPWGYYIDEEFPDLLLPDIRAIRALQIGLHEYENNGFTAPVICDWIKKNTGRSLHPARFSKLRLRRPVFKAVHEPYEKRLELYRTTLRETEEAAEEKYKEYVKLRHPGRRKVDQDPKELEEKYAGLGEED